VTGSDFVSDFVSVFAQDFGFGSKILHMFPVLKSMGVLILGVLICVDFFEIFWYIWWDFVDNHGKPEDEPGEGREDEPIL
jgi:hypothetical protein